MNSQIALYRKYRPATFAEVRGQEQVTEPLRQALRNGRINHAYLFSGPRGCGKTSSARILARSLNCEQGTTPDPCGQCEPCVALAPDGPGSIDVIEIDAASHGGVDDARDLRERAFFAPVNSRYKVYIVDEAHMVTREGFNALLKLVEEPPPHLKFVFATTEPDKVVSTIRSRTHHYPFRLIPPATLRGLMEEILNDEGIPFETAALPLVVRAGAGSARDSLSILDQLLAGAGEDGITRGDAVALLGYTDSALLTEMVDALGARDGASVFALIDRVMEGGHDPRRFTADLLERLRDLMVLAAVPDAVDKGLINVSPDAVERMAEQAARLGPAELARAAEILNQGLTEMRGATSPRLLLELLCAKALLPGAEASGDSGSAVLARLERLERRVDSGSAAPVPVAPQEPAPRQEPRDPSAQAAPEPRTERREAAPGPPPDDDWPEVDRSARPQQAQQGVPAGAPTPRESTTGESGSDIGTLTGAWPRVLEAVKQRSRATWMILTGYKVEVAGVDGGGGTVQLGFSDESGARGFTSNGNNRIVEAAIGDVLGSEVRVTAVPAGGTQAGRQAAVSQPAAAQATAAESAGTQPTATRPEPDPVPESEVDEPVPDTDVTADADDTSPEPDGAGEVSGSVLIEQELGGKVIDEIDHTG